MWHKSLGTALVFGQSRHCRRARQQAGGGDCGRGMLGLLEAGYLTPDPQVREVGHVACPRCPCRPTPCAASVTTSKLSDIPCCSSNRNSHQQCWRVWMGLLPHFFGLLVHRPPVSLPPLKGSSRATHPPTQLTRCRRASKMGWVGVQHVQLCSLGLLNYPGNWQARGLPCPHLVMGGYHRGWACPDIRLHLALSHTGHHQG